MLWRWLVVILLVVNVVLLVLYVRGDVRPEAPQPVIPELDAGIPRLMLVSEVDHLQSREANSARCFSIGPLNSLLAQQRAEDRLRPTSLWVRSRQTTSDRDRGWWVYLPAGSRSAALELTRRLTEAGLEDFFVVTRGDMENVVSVGLYENIDNARTRQRQVRAAGFEAQMEIRRESVPQFWVEYQTEPGMESAWRFIIEASPGAQHREIPCLEVAPEEREP